MNVLTGYPDELNDLWGQVPNMVNCKGLCHTSCGPVPINGVEKAAIAARGKKMEVHDGANGAMTCSLLDEDNKCSIYDIRPTMCRVWGAAEALKCPYGCAPERYMSDMEVFNLIQAVTDLSGEHPEAAMDNMKEILGPELERIWEEEVGKPAKEAAATGRPVEWREKT